MTHTKVITISVLEQNTKDVLCMLRCMHIRQVFKRHTFESVLWRRSVATHSLYDIWQIAWEKTLQFQLHFVVILLKNDHLEPMALRVFLDSMVRFTWKGSNELLDALSLCTRNSLPGLNDYSYELWPKPNVIVPMLEAIYFSS